MAVGFDSILGAPSATPPPTAIPTPRTTPINPAQERSRSGAEQRAKDQSKDSAEFRASLDSVAPTSTTVDAIAEVQARRFRRQVEAEKNARNEKLPTRGPTELAADEGERLYAAAQKRTAASQQTERPDEAELVIPSSHEFLAAASRYAERFLSVANAYAKPGESLEISA